MSFDLIRDASKRVLIAAHRGECGGNIPCNTIASFEIALSHGADVIEVDVTKSAEGTLWIFHPTMEQIHLGCPGRLGEMNDGEIKKLRYVNYDRVPTQFGLCTFDELLERFKGRCYINVDKFWENPKEIAEAVRKHGTADQIIVKSAPRRELFDMMEDYPEIAYLPILKEEGGVHEELMRRKIRYVGCEVVFSDETKGVGRKDFIDKLHSDRKIVWANAIIYDHKAQLAGGHSDDSSFTVSPEYGWGWLADRGYDIIQTDWTLAMKEYLEKTTRRKRPFGREKAK